MQKSSFALFGYIEFKTDEYQYFRTSGHRGCKAQEARSTCMQRVSNELETRTNFCRFRILHEFELKKAAVVEVLHSKTAKQHSLSVKQDFTAALFSEHAKA